MRLEVALLLRLVLATKLSASMPTNTDAMLVGSVLLGAALLLRLASPCFALLRLVRAVGLRAAMPSDANISFVLYTQPPTPHVLRFLPPFAFLATSPSSPPSSSPSLPPSFPSTLITTCPFGTFGISKTSTFSSVRPFGQMPSHPFPQALCHIVLYPLQKSASTPLPLPLQLSKQNWHPRGPSGSCSTFTLSRGGSELLILLVLHSDKSPCYKATRQVLQTLQQLPLIVRHVYFERAYEASCTVDSARGP